MLEILITIAKVGAPIVVALIGIWKVNSLKDKKLTELFEKVSDTNTLLVNSLKDNGDLLKDLNANFLLINEPLLIDDKNQGSILKDAIFQKFGKEFVDKMLNIFTENHIDKEERTLLKINASITTLLKNTYDKISVINGLKNYVRDIDGVFVILEEGKINKRILDLFKKAKSDSNYNLRYELFSLFEVVYAETCL